MPFGKPYEYWVEKYWNWTASIPPDDETVYAGLEENGCFSYEHEDSVLMLIDPAVGGEVNQKCEISGERGILFPLWSAECDATVPGYATASFAEISKCARAFNLGDVKAEVWVDNVPIAKLDVLDYTTNINTNVTELYTKEFNITIPSNTHLLADKYGTFGAAVHGWFVFLKPLPPGEHELYLKNNVIPTTLSGASNSNKADIKYTLIVK
jgi:hypothetical protein